jgi:acyl-homoserine lactone synthase
MAVHVISAANKHLYQDAIESHFRIRHEIFVGERGWKALERSDGREVDQFDNEDSIYLLAMDGARIVGGHRLYPTLKPTMISEVFPHLAGQRGIPSDAYIWEWSRLFAVKERRDRRIYLQLLAALQELCLDEGVTQISGVLEIWWVPGFQQVGMVVHPLGLPANHNNDLTMAALFDVSTHTVDQIKSIGGISGSVLVRRGPWCPLIARAMELSHQKSARAS